MVFGDSWPQLDGFTAFKPLAEPSQWKGMAKGSGRDAEKEGTCNGRFRSLPLLYWGLQSAGHYCLHSGQALPPRLLSQVPLHLKFYFMLC